MRSVLTCAAAFAAATGLLGEAPAANMRPDDAARMFAATGARTAPIASYTSRLHVDLALRSFPYLRFHLTGTMSYKRPDVYSVHFEHVPWFGKGFEDIKADPLQPATWPDHYDVASIARDGDRTHVEMRDKTAGNIKGVHAELDGDGLRRIQWLYVNGGNIDVHVNPQVIDGVPVPQTEDAEIVLPAYHVSAHATFSDYKIVVDGAPGAR